MPYQAIDDLPENVRHVLPNHAQQIYLSSFNNAQTEYKDNKKRRNPKEDLETLCHKVAWKAVKLKYSKTKEGHWIEKQKQ